MKHPQNPAISLNELPMKEAPGVEFPTAKNTELPPSSIMESAIIFKPSDTTVTKVSMYREGTATPSIESHGEGGLLEGANTGASSINEGGVTASFSAESDTEVPINEEREATPLSTVPNTPIPDDEGGAIVVSTADMGQTSTEQTHAEQDSDFGEETPTQATSATSVLQARKVACLKRKRDDEQNMRRVLKLRITKIEANDSGVCAQNSGDHGEDLRN